MSQHTAHAHDSAAVRAGARNAPALLVTFALVGVSLAITATVGVAIGSLALISDAGHQLTDVVALGMALAAVSAASRASHGVHHTYGLYRLEVLAALANAVLLFGVAGFVLFSAVQRFGDPVEVPGLPMLAVALLGAGVNVAGWLLLRRGARESLNIEAAYVEVLADLVGSIGVIAAAIVITVTGWIYTDIVFGAAIGLYILPRAWRLGAKALRILVQAAPRDLDLQVLRRELRSEAGALDVHDLHVWTLTSEMNVASAHLMVHEDDDAHAVLDRAAALLRDRYAIAHATLQVEPHTHEGCAAMSW
ncbi:MAG: cation diffusion facilitator family transporter [Dehalococcoidia bacterium]